MCIRDRSMTTTVNENVFVVDCFATSLTPAQKVLTTMRPLSTLFMERTVMVARTLTCPCSILKHTDNACAIYAAGLGFSRPSLILVICSSDSWSHRATFQAQTEFLHARWDFQHFGYWASCCRAGFYCIPMQLLALKNSLYLKQRER